MGNEGESFDNNFFSIMILTRFEASLASTRPSFLSYQQKAALYLNINSSFCTRDILGRSVVVAVLSDDQVVVLTQVPGCIKNSNL